jgi:hypothetical protein
VGRKLKSALRDFGRAAAATVVMFWVFHYVDRGAAVFETPSEWWLCLVCSLAAGLAFVGIGITTHLGERS